MNTKISRDFSRERDRIASTVVILWWDAEDVATLRIAGIPKKADDQVLRGLPGTVINNIQYGWSWWREMWHIL